MSAAAQVELTFGGSHGVKLQNDRNVNGLISMEFEVGKRPKDPVRVVRAWLKGVSDKMFENIEKMSLTDLKVPVRARGVVPDGGFVSFARNEQGEVWAHASEEGTAWCEKRMDGVKGERALRAAGKQILDEIGKVPLEKQGKSGVDLET